MDHNKPILGYCSGHPKEPAIVAETDRKTGKKTRFCRDCWDHHRVAKLHHSPTFDARSLMDQKATVHFNFTPVAEMAKARVK